MLNCFKFHIFLTKNNKDIVSFLLKTSSYKVSLFGQMSRRYIMVPVTELSLSNVVVFKKAAIPFDGSGLTLITGINQDANLNDDGNKTENKTNATGKTLLLSTIPTILYGSPPLSNKKNSRKDILTSLSSIKLSFTATDSSGEVANFTVNQSAAKYSLYKNGVDLKVRTMERAKEILANLFPLTETDLYNYVYLSTQRPLSFLYETNSKRSEIISDLFRFGIHDALKDYFLSQQRNLKTDIGVLNSILSEKEEVSSRLKSCSWTKKLKIKLKQEKINQKNIQESLLSQVNLLSNIKLALNNLYRIQNLYSKKIEYITQFESFFTLYPSLESTPRPELLKLLQKELNYRDTVFEYATKLDLYKQKILKVKTTIKSKSKSLLDLLNLEFDSKELQKTLQNTQIFKNINFSVIHTLEKQLQSCLLACSEEQAKFLANENLLKNKIKILDKIYENILDIFKDIPFPQDLQKSRINYIRAYIKKISLRMNTKEDKLEESISQLLEKITERKGFITKVIKDMEKSKDKVSQHNIDTENKKGTMRCPTCGSEVSEGYFDKIIENYSKQRETLTEKQNRLLHAKKIVIANKNLSQYVSQIKSLLPTFSVLDIENIKTIFDSQKEALKAIQNKSSNNSYFITHAESLRDTLYQYKVIKNQESPQKTYEDSTDTHLSKIDLEHLKSMIFCLEKLRKATQEYNSCVVSYSPTIKEVCDSENIDINMDSTFIDNLIHNLKAKRQNQDIQVKNIQEQNIAVSESLTQLHKRKNSYDLYKSRYLDLIEKQKEYEDKTQDKDILASLILAYGSKGLKNIALSQVAVSLQHYLNTFSDLLFAENMSFSVTATSTGISALVTRSNNKVSDVRLLSGSESNCFSLIYLLSLLAMMPSSRRTNFVVLDEMDSHMDAACKDRFYTKYLPVLKSVIDNVFVITPRKINSNMLNSFSRIITVVKRGGVSKLSIKTLSPS